MDNLKFVSSLLKERKAWGHLLDCCLHPIGDLQYTETLLTIYMGTHSCDLWGLLSRDL
jgi:hypothetical protein